MNYKDGVNIYLPLGFLYKEYHMADVRCPLRTTAGILQKPSALLDRVNRVEI